MGSRRLLGVLLAILVLSCSLNQCYGKKRGRHHHRHHSNPPKPTVPNNPTVPSNLAVPNNLVPNNPAVQPNRAVQPNQNDPTVNLLVDTNVQTAKKASNTLFGVFFEEINHAGAGGMWAELVQNRGFEAMGRTENSKIDPWGVIGDQSFIKVATDLTSPFPRNKVALRAEILCDGNQCPPGGVGVFNPGFWGMNIEQGKSYRVIFYVKSTDAVNIAVSFTSSDGLRTMATSNVIANAPDVSIWKRMEVILKATQTDHNSRLQLTTRNRGVLWFDQVSAMPLDTFRGLGFRPDLVEMVANLKPRFMRYPGGCFVEGERLIHRFNWKDSVGPWEQRPGHWGDIWNYWTDEGLGYYEFLRLAEELGTASVWVINNGISHKDSIAPKDVQPYVQDMLDSIEFARGPATSYWGKLRAQMGHPAPFELKYVAIGNEDCDLPNYRANYMLFYDAIKKAYPDIEAISNCDATKKKLDHPADMYDYHIYTNAADLFSKSTYFDRPDLRGGPKAFVSEYAVTGPTSGNGTLLAALAEGGYLIGLERNSDIIEMASYAPLFVNVNDRKWNPDAIVFDSWQHYATPSYYLLQFFIESNGATVLKSNAQPPESIKYMVASAIVYQNQQTKKESIKIKVANFGTTAVNLKIILQGLQPNSIDKAGSKQTVMTSENVMDENSFANPKKIAPVDTPLPQAGPDMDVVIAPHSFNSFDLLKAPGKLGASDL